VNSWYHGDPIATERVHHVDEHRGLPMTLILICNASDRFGLVDAGPARIHPREANEPGIPTARYLVEP
jgi:hypothetical protein